MALRLVVPMQAAPGRRDELIESFRIRCKEVREEPGCEQYEIYQSTERPDQLILLERWQDEETLEAHLELNRQRGNTTAHLRTGTATLERYTIE